MKFSTIAKLMLGLLLIISIFTINNRVGIASSLSIDDYNAQVKLLVDDKIFENGDIIDANSDIKVCYDITIPDEIIVNDGDTLELNLPEELQLSGNTKFNIKDSENQLVGTAIQTSRNKIMVRFSNYFHYYSKNKHLSLNIYTNFDKKKIKLMEEVKLNFDGIIIEANISELGGINPFETIGMESLIDENDPSLIHWKIRVNLNKEVIKNAKFENYIGDNQELLIDSIEANYGDFQFDSDDSLDIGFISSSHVESEKIQYTNEGFNIKLGDLNKKSVQINFDTKNIKQDVSQKYDNFMELWGNEILISKYHVMTHMYGGSGFGEGIYLGEAELIKKDKDTGDVLEGAVFDLYNNNNQLIQKSFSTDSMGKIKINNLAIGNYKLVEVKAPNGYQLDSTPIDFKIENNKKEPVQFYKTNKKIDILNISGEVTWDDDENQDGIRPESIIIDLLANGDLIASKKVSEADKWSYNFTNLIKYKEGREILYTIKETEIPGYRSEINGYNLTNIHSSEKLAFKVTKIWEDYNNKYHKRPKNVSVQLLANNKPFGNVVTLSNTNNWTFIWNNLNLKSKGKNIQYTVKEINIPKEYKAIVKTDIDHATLINVYKQANDNNLKRVSRYNNTSSSTNEEKKSQLPKTGEENRNMWTIIGLLILLSISKILISSCRY